MGVVGGRGQRGHHHPEHAAGGCRRARAIVLKEPGVVAGLEVARLTFREIDAHLTFEPLTRDGEPIEAGVAVARVFGSAGAHPHRRAHGAQLPSAPLREWPR